MIDVNLLTQRDFIGVRGSLITACGNDANRAVVLTRIFWRTDANNVAMIEREGHRWWRAKYQTIADETGLTIGQLKRIIPWLVEHGFLETAEHRLDGITDRTLSLRVLAEDPQNPSTVANATLEVANATVEVANATVESAKSDRQGSAESDSLPIKTSDTNTTTRVRDTRTPETEITEDWQPTRADVEWGLAKGFTVEHMKAETERFVNHFLANGKKMRRWNLSWRNWMTNRFVNGGTVSTPPKNRGQMPADRVAETRAIGARLQAQMDAQTAEEAW